MTIDILSSKAILIMTNDDDKEFLLNQMKKGRVESRGGIDGKQCQMEI